MHNITPLSNLSVYLKRFGKIGEKKKQIEHSL